MLDVIDSVLSGESDILAAPRELRPYFRVFGPAYEDLDMNLLTIIDGETEALPLGRERELWDPDALDRKEPEVARAREWALQQGLRKALENVRKRVVEELGE